jgi:hypothetical protein
VHSFLMLLEVAFLAEAFGAIVERAFKRSFFDVHTEVVHEIVPTYVELTFASKMVAF